MSEGVGGPGGGATRGAPDELFAAIEADDVVAVRALVTAHPASASARDPEGVSALMRAIYRLDGELTEAILTAAPDLDIHEAAALGRLDALAVLLSAGAGADADADADADVRSADGFAPLHLAAFFGRYEAVALLLDRGVTVDPPGRGWMTGTPLHSAASGRHAEVVRLLLEAGADPNARQSGGWTPLHSAAHNGDAGIARLLIEHGADGTAVNDDGVTVLSMAQEHGDPSTIAAVRSASGSDQRP